MIISEITALLEQLDIAWLDIDPALLEIPQDRSMGDVALPCFLFAKALRMAPQQIAEKIVGQLTPLLDSPQGEGSAVEKVIATGPYVNFFVNPAWLANQLIETVLEQGDRYGAGAEKDKTVLIEWRSPNTHKMLHVGHLRNALISETMCSITEFSGSKVIRVAYGGDIGAHVAKRIWYYTHFVHEEYPSDPSTFGIRSWNIYQAATEKVDDNPKEYKEQIHEVQRLLESGDEELNEVWQKTRDLSIAWLKQSFSELWCRIEKFYRESEVEKPWVALVKQYEQDVSIPEIKMSEWAVIADLEAYDLWVFLLLKSNGTSLYSTKDIALAYMKKQDYDFDISLYVVATEQNLHFQQLFKTLALTGYDTSKLVHMWYELVELPDGKMSSRKGTIIPYHVWRHDAMQQAMSLIEQRNLDDKEKVAHDVAFAALKFSLLLQDTYKKIRINIKKSISFQGETGPYLQYTYARIESIKLKATRGKLPAENITYTLLQKEEERMLLVLLHEFSGIVQRAAEEYKPHLVARYVLDLAKMFNSYYQKYKIVQEDKNLEWARVALITSVQQVLKNGLTLLGIATPNHM